MQDWSEELGNGSDQEVTNDYTHIDMCTDSRKRQKAGVSCGGDPGWCEAAREKQSQ